MTQGEATSERYYSFEELEEVEKYVTTEMARLMKSAQTSSVEALLATYSTRLRGIAVAKEWMQKNPDRSWNDFVVSREGSSMEESVGWMTEKMDDLKRQAEASRG